MSNHFFFKYIVHYFYSPYYKYALKTNTNNGQHPLTYKPIHPLYGADVTTS